MSVVKPKNLGAYRRGSGGLPLNELTCRACSGYGNCGYRMYRISEGKPVVICQMRRAKLLEGQQEVE